MTDGAEPTTSRPGAPDERAGRSRIVATVSGAVQGVGFRMFVRREASALGLEGWAANRADGSVEVVAEGSADALDRLVARLREGPPAAIVRAVDVRSEPARGLSGGFGVRSGDHRGD